MSILDVWLDGDRALIAVDTECVNPDLTRSSGAKMHLLPHADMVVAGRGLVRFTRAIYELLNMFDYRYDEAVLNLDAAFKSADDYLRERAEIDGLDVNCPAFVEQNVVLLGWSDTANAFKVTWRARADNGLGFVESHIDSWAIAPGEPSWCGIPTDACKTFDEAFSVAAWQCHFAKRLWPQKGVGGSIIAAELTRGRIDVRSRSLD